MTTHRLTDDSEALSYDRLEQPWRDWAKIASSFIRQLDNHQDREDLMHDIIVRLAEVAEEYRRKGKPLTKWGSIKVAQYTRLRFYHQKKRWRRVFTVSLNSEVRDDDGNGTQLMDTIIDPKRVDLDAWIDYLNSPEKVRRAIQKLVDYGDGDGHRLSGYEWKLIRQFRKESKEKALA